MGAGLMLHALCPLKALGIVLHRNEDVALIAQDFTQMDSVC